MVYKMVHREPLYRIFRASSCSSAFFIKTFLQILEILLPLIIIFTTHGLWKKFGEFREVPSVSYEGKYLILINGNSNNYIFSSSFPALNVGQQNRTSVAEESWQWVSSEQLKVDIRIPLNNRSVESLLFIVFLQYELDYHTIVRAQLALTDTVNQLDGVQQLVVTGVLRADQSRPFHAFNHISQLVDESQQDLDYFKPGSILSRIAFADLALTIGRQSLLRIPRSADSSSFTFSLNLQVTEDRYLYKTDFWELLKWAWIQYLAIYFVIRYLCQEMRTYLFANNVIETIPSTK